MPCPEGIGRMSSLLYDDVVYNHYRTMGLRAFLEHPWSPWAKKGMQAHFERRLETLRRCTRCGLCEERCPYHIRILDLFERMLADHPTVIEALRERDWATLYKDAPSPYR